MFFLFLKRPCICCFDNSVVLVSKRGQNKLGVCVSLIKEWLIREDSILKGGKSCSSFKVIALGEVGWDCVGTKHATLGVEKMSKNKKRTISIYRRDGETFAFVVKTRIDFTDEITGCWIDRGPRLWVKFGRNLIYCLKLDVDGNEWTQSVVVVSNMKDVPVMGTMKGCLVTRVHEQAAFRNEHVVDDLSKHLSTEEILDMKEDYVFKSLSLESNEICVEDIMSNDAKYQPFRSDLLFYHAPKQVLVLRSESGITMALRHNRVLFFQKARPQKQCFRISSNESNCVLLDEKYILDIDSGRQLHRFEGEAMYKVMCKDAFVAFNVKEEIEVVDRFVFDRSADSYNGNNMLNALNTRHSEGVAEMNRLEKIILEKKNLFEQVTSSFAASQEKITVTSVEILSVTEDCVSLKVVGIWISDDPAKIGKCFVYPFHSICTEDQVKESKG